MTPQPQVEGHATFHRFVLHGDGTEHCEIWEPGGEDPLASIATGREVWPGIARQMIVADWLADVNEEDAKREQGQEGGDDGSRTV